MRVLFIPVSAPQGIGEYARAREMAAAVLRRWPEAQVHFIVSRMASYASEVPFPVTLLPSSPTLHPGKVAQVMREFRPTLVVFDNAGRTSQLRAAHCLGAGVVYISSRGRQRRRAFRLRWMHLIDEHWIAYPEFVAGALSAVERLKLRLMRRPTVRYLDTIMPESTAEQAAAVLKRFELTAQDYVVLVPGGGLGHPGTRDAPQLMAEAAERLSKSGIPTLLLGAHEPPAESRPALLRHVPRLPMAELVAVLREARVVVVNGGDTLLQALVCGCACVATPIAGDQGARIARCEAAGLVKSAALEAGALEQAARILWQDEATRRGLKEKIQAQALANSLPKVLEAFSRLATTRR